YQDNTVFPGVAYTYRVRPIGAEGTVGSAGVKTSDFRVFDCTYFRNKPEPARYGMEKVYITGNGFLWQADKPQGGVDNNTPNERATRNVARTASDRGEILVIDIEHWPVDIRVAKEAEVQSTIRKFIQIIDWVRAERPDVKIGIYGFGPLRDYWTPVSYLGAVEKPNDKWQQAHLAEFKQKYQQWQKANDFLKPLMEKVDYVFPSLYTFSNNPPSWVLYAKGNIEEARRYGKPVIPFVWMDYHNSTTLAGQTISGEFWRVQLQTLRQLADGVVIWGGVQFSKDGKSQPRLWNENDPWWVETKAFLTAP
ncbi:MAG TPA: hypothetical protein VHP11_00225, partial [Tepidisphaeraceae bacterium]|nr:hypothetical protein [Tepidisphaeraceae bacterium]